MRTLASVSLQVIAGCSFLALGAIEPASSTFMMTSEKEGQLPEGRKSVQQKANPSYSSWLEKFVSTFTEHGQLLAKVCQIANDSNPANDTVVSEGMGYGMLLAAANQDQGTFDALYRYVVKNKNANGLMHWQIQGSVVKGRGSATDADEDIAYALIQAAKTWKTGAFNYSDEARKMIAAFKQFDCYQIPIGLSSLEIAVAGKAAAPAPMMIITGPVISPGDEWGKAGRQNFASSYFAPDRYLAFYEMTQDPFWQQLISNCLSIVEGVADLQTGLCPDWFDPQTNQPSLKFPKQFFYGDDACRVPWRLAKFYLKIGDPQLKNQVGDWLLKMLHVLYEGRSIDGGLYAGYALDGTALNQNLGGPQYMAPVAAALAILDRGNRLDQDLRNWLMLLSKKVNQYLDEMPSPRQFLGHSYPYYNTALALLCQPMFNNDE